MTTPSHAFDGPSRQAECDWLTSRLTQPPVPAPANPNDPAQLRSYRVALMISHLRRLFKVSSIFNQYDAGVYVALDRYDARNQLSSAEIILACSSDPRLAHQPDHLEHLLRQHLQQAGFDPDVILGTPSRLTVISHVPGQYLQAFAEAVAATDYQIIHPTHTLFSCGDSTCLGCSGPDHINDSRIFLLRSR